MTELDMALGPPNHQWRPWDRTAQVKPLKLTEAMDRTPSAQWGRGLRESTNGLPMTLNMPKGPA